MTNSDLTQLLVIVDRSGSMISCAEDMTGGLNTLFEEQAKLPGKCVVDYVQFDNQYELVFWDKPVSEARAQLNPRGSTALLDAIGRGVTELGEKLAKLDEADRPGTVMVAIVTDGYENSSREWTTEKVKELIEKQQSQWNWDFVFLGANMDAVAEGEKFGIAAASSMTYDTHYSGGTTQSLSNYTSALRTTGHAAFSDEDRAKATGKS
jgi:hypothetical protein